MPSHIYAYKLFRVRKDGSIGSLFINPKERYELNSWMTAKPYKRDGFQFRPGWHSLNEPKAPHLSLKGRAWFLVKISSYTTHTRPVSQGGKWFLSNKLSIVRPLSESEMKHTVNYETVSEA